MKISVPKKIGILFTVMLSVFQVSIAQTALNGGSIQVAPTGGCFVQGSPAPTINSISAASGGNANYSYQWEAKTSASAWINVIGAHNLYLNPGVLFTTTTYRRRVMDIVGVVSFSNEVTLSATTSFSAGSIGVYLEETIAINTNPTNFVSNGPAAGGSGNYTYEWETSTSETGPWSSIGISALSYQSPAISAIGIFYFRRKVTDNTCGATGIAGPLKVIVAPIVPLNGGKWTTTSICVFPGNTPAYLTSYPAMGGTLPYFYQWEQKTASTNWTVINGATGLDYQPPVLTESTSFRRKVTDAAGNITYTINADQIEYITANTEPGVIGVGDKIFIAPNALALGLVNLQHGTVYPNYSWQKTTDNLAWQNVTDPQAFVASYYIADSSLTVNTCFRRVATSVCANVSKIAYSNILCLEAVNPLKPGTIVIAGGNNCVAIGTTSIINESSPASGGSIPYSYQWEKSIDAVNFAEINNATSPNYSTGELTAPTSFRRRVTDNTGTFKYSDTVLVKISTGTLKGGIIDGPIVTCSGTTVGIINNILDACGGSAPLEYVWEINSGSGWSDVSNTNAPTYNAGAISTDTKFRRKIKDGCGTLVTSNEVPVYVYPAIEAGSVYPFTQQICPNTQTASIISLTQNCHYTNGTVSYVWQKSSSATGPWLDIYGATLPFYQPTNVTQTTYYRLKVSSTVCGAVAYTNVSAVTAFCVDSPVPTPGPTGNRVAMQVYPNPAQTGGNVVVKISGEGSSFKVTLRGTDGRSYNCTAVQNGDGQLNVKLPLGISKGMYIIQITSTKKQWTDKILVY